MNCAIRTVLALFLISNVNRCIDNVYVTTDSKNHNHPECEYGI